LLDEVVGLASWGSSYF